MGGFARLHQSTMLDGSLSTVTKELMALAISVAVHCDGCIAYHVHDALAAGATREQVVEALDVAVLMGGGPAVVYASQALEALDQFSSSTLG
ncbi:MAG: carboxymuconolactone decarboxylase family protein [Chloroflexi bacterium]|nr:carboxymuconolactone decarboxylase family protein [Chloroflexota bacterium]